MSNSPFLMQDVKITDPDGYMSDTMSRWADSVSNNNLLIGVGNPEGVVAANVGRIYMDNTGVTGSILYIKRDANTGGDKSLGWVLI